MTGGKIQLDKTEELFKGLTEAAGVPGYEVEVRAVLRQHLEPVAEIMQDRMGSLIARLPGTADRPRVMLAGHMDEIGFMVKFITEEGFVRFVPLGGWWDQVLLAQRVVIKTGDGEVEGIIGAKPPHLLPQEERKKVVEKKDMYIDVGATSREEVEAMGIRLGDPIIPVTEFTPLASGKTYLAKAWDDRVGCALIVQTMHSAKEQGHPNTLYGVGTVQEEVGLRGAKTSAEVVDPDVALILESDIPGDVPGIEVEESAVKLGQGPTLLLYDARMIPNLELRDLVIDTAKELDIPLQLSAMQGGATDGGMIHLHGQGVPTVVLGVPARHIHSHVGIIHRDDYDHAVKLLVAVIRKLDAERVAGLTA
jgi:putative aminopeptidase FrvX